MTAITTSHHIDVLDLDVLQRQGEDGHRVTITLPTARAGRETAAGATRLKNLLRVAAEELETRGMDGDGIDSLLSPAHALVQDVDFWQHQADGLLVLLDDRGQVHFRLSAELPEAVSIGDRWRLEPLVHLLAAHEQFHLLAFSPNSVRLFLTDGTRIGELDLGDMPTGADDVFRDRDHQESLQHSAQGGGDANFHGHGAGDEAREVDLERFLRHLARGLEERIMVRDRHPLVLAAVEDTARAFTDHLDWAEVVDPVVAGKPDHLQPGELVDQAAPVIDAHRRRTVDEHLAQLDRARSAGRLATDASEVVRAAAEGRVETLFVPLPEAGNGLVPLTPVDAVIADVLATSGTVEQSPEADGQLAAVLRY